MTAVVPDESGEAGEVLAALARVMEIKAGPKRVRTVEGVEKYNAPIGTPIVARPRLPRIRVGPKPEWDSELDWQTNHARDAAWTHDIRVALSLGQLTQAEAKPLGYHDMGHDNREVIRIDGRPAGGWQPLPRDLWHVTTAATLVRAHGLKTRDELNQDSGAGLGGGESDTISFTVNPELAETIRDSILEMRAVARGEFTPADMIEAARRGDGADKPFLTHLISQTQRDYKAGDPYPLGIQAMLDGYDYSVQHGGGGVPRAFSSVAEVDAEFGVGVWEPVGEGTEVPKSRIYHLWRRPVTPELQAERATDFFKTFLAWREYAGGPSNPVFFSSDAVGLANLDPDEIQVLHFHPAEGGSGYPLGGMNEWRTASGRAVVLAPDSASPALTPIQERGLDALRTHPVNRQLGDAFAAAGHPLFLVGGSVRDALAGHPDFADLDFTTDATPEEIHVIVDSMGSVWTIGEEFGTVAVEIEGLKTEITTFRTEEYDEASRKPVVAFGDNITDDLRRRDLTMNALALTLATDGTHPVGSLVDPHNGARDLAAGVLRTPDDPHKSMSEDPLRQLRVVRFAAKRGASPEPGLSAAIRELAPRLEIIATERKTAELRKILAGGPETTIAAMEMANDLGIAVHLFGGLDTSDETMAVLSRLPADADATTILAVLAARSPSAPRLMTAMRLSSDEIRPAIDAARIAHRMSDPSAPADIPIARSIVRDSTPMTLSRGFIAADALGDADGQSTPLRVAVGAVVDNEESAVRAPLPIDGHDLVERGLEGPPVGAALERVKAAFLANPKLTRAQALLIARPERDVSTKSPADRVPTPNPDPDLDLGDLAALTAALAGPPSPDGRPKAVIFDRDGTLASVPKAPVGTIGPDGHPRPASPEAWHEYNAALPFDRPVPRVAALLRAVPPGVVRIMVSGRAEGDHPGDRRRRFQMQDWIVKHELPIDDLFMRSGGDMRRDSIVKEELLTTEILEKYDVRFAVDDRPQVLAVWKAHDIPTLAVVGPDLGFPIADQEQGPPRAGGVVDVLERVAETKPTAPKVPSNPLTAPLSPDAFATFAAARTQLPDSSDDWFDFDALSAHDKDWRRASSGPGPIPLQREAQIRSVGQTLDDEVQRRLKAAKIPRPLSDVQRTQLRKKRDAIETPYQKRKWDLMTSVSMELFGKDWTDLDGDEAGLRSTKVMAVIAAIHERNPDLAEMERKSAAILNRLVASEKPYADAYAIALESVLSQIRPMGGQFDAKADIQVVVRKPGSLVDTPGPSGPNSGVIPFQWRHQGPWDSRSGRPVNIDRVAMKDYNQLDPQNQKRVREAIRALEQGGANIEPKTRALKGTYGVRIDKEARMLVYPHVDGTWHIYAVIPHHDYREAERRMGGAAEGMVPTIGMFDPANERYLSSDERARVEATRTAAAAITDASRRYPTAWIDRSNAGKPFFVSQASTGRGYYAVKHDPDEPDGLFLGNDLANPSIAIHELAHRMESIFRPVTAAEWAFHWRRTSKMETLYSTPPEAQDALADVNRLQDERRDLRYTLAGAERRSGSTVPEIAAVNKRRAEERQAALWGVEANLKEAEKRLVSLQRRETYLGRREPLKAMTMLTPGAPYATTESARPDKYPNPYVGKDYGDGPTNNYEVLSMGMEGIWTGSQPMWKDDEYRHLIIGLLAAV